MKKKFFAWIAALALSTSTFASILPTAAAVDSVGGFDFYSITIRYSEEILVDYDDDFTDSKNEYSDTLVIGTGTPAKPGFFQVQAEDKIVSDAYYSKVPKRNGFITHITDGSAIVSAEKINLFGVSDPYDDEPYVNQNPNIKYADDGYALAQEKDESGEHSKIDVNGYLVESDMIWRTREDERVELFVQVPVVKKTGVIKKNGDPETTIVASDNYEWIPLDQRLDENGKIANIQNLEYNYMATNDEYDAFLESDENELKLYRAADEDTFKKASRKAKDTAYAQTYLVKGNDFSTDKTFTQDDIVRDANGFVTFASPKMGTPLSAVTIEEITIEIDALGTQLYDDINSDPQQKNTITLSLNECKYNAEMIKQWYDEALYTEEEYFAEKAFVLGTAKAETTRTEIETSKTKYKETNDIKYSPTVKSVKLDLNKDVLSNLPYTANIYLDFSISENQPAEAFDEAYQKDMLEGELDSNDVSLLTDADKPKANTPTNSADSFLTKKILGPISGTGILIIGGGIIVVIAAVIVVIVALKDKKKDNTKDTDKDNENNK